jgi:hypothetical protein
MGVRQARWVENSIDNKPQQVKDVHVDPGHQAAWTKMYEGGYLGMDELLTLIPKNTQLLKLLDDHRERIYEAKGSSNNHQAWEGGYLDHVVETMNIACQQYVWMSGARPLPFSLGQALAVMFLHDIEKPWKHSKIRKNPDECVCGHLLRDHWETKGNACIVCQTAEKPCLQFVSIDPPVLMSSKQDRKNFRRNIIVEYGIELTDAQWNALAYVEGVPDSEYTPGERTMGELAAFCYCCDIISARLWWNEGTKGW